MNHSVLVIDDHPLFRQALASLLQRLGTEMQVYEAATVVSAMDLLCKTDDLDLILYDWQLPDGGGGVRGLIALRQLVPEVPVIVISAAEDDAVKMAAKEIGAASFLSKAATPQELHAQIQNQLSLCPHRSLGHGFASRRRGTPAIQLTHRERAVLRLLATGSANKQIACMLEIENCTVRAHVSSILRALGANNRTEAVVKATALGLLGC